MSNLLVIGNKGQLGTDCMSVFGEEALGIDLPEIDISDRFQCLEKLNELRPEVIVNCAAYTAVDACESDPSCWRANADGPKHLAEWTADNNAFLAHISTDYVFSGDKPLFQSLEESEAPNPVSEYGRSKLAGERAVLESGADVAILRTAWLYGAHGKNFLKTMLRLTLQNPQKEFKVVSDQYGSPTWSYTLARQIKAVVDQRATGIFHASSEGFCSWYDLACAFLDEMGVAHHFIPCSTEEFPTPTKRPANSILENSELKKNNLNVSKHWKTELEMFVKAHREELLDEALALIN
ncbi:MAG: dTDP-4-dehydrorhamnose reductase [Kiritimatiellaeota bacterium]|nr:dTDP-4-dehydrorhamnose reductase [Kiritimatiellota bacterium]